MLSGLSNINVCWCCTERKEGSRSWMLGSKMGHNIRPPTHSHLFLIASIKTKGGNFTNFKVSHCVRFRCRAAVVTSTDLDY